ncbi:hypothetical protein [Streptococcus saliviloxodontae]|uniref:Glucan-binding repeat-containing protein n=1 Tax=Streptococcus saliviloxodontae TaxID=1349416 RepID=A0ABS2PIL6_9STRE|nr:hypothetical protein [Streptococcus saliviloxodontae]MBM7635280.1 glucan-binding repeat-containing protein [Streptococcus saliviloxodontae]
MKKNQFRLKTSKKSIISLATVSALSLAILSQGATLTLAEDQTSESTTVTTETSSATSAQSETTSIQSTTEGEATSSELSTETETETTTTSETETETEAEATTTTDSKQAETKTQGWVGNDGKWYYYNEDGKPLTGQQTIDGTSYYFNEDGSQQKGGSVIIDGTTYFADSDTGKLDKGQWISAGSWTYPSGDTDYYWAYKANGKNVKGFQTIDGDEYYFYDSGRQAKGSLIENEDGSLSYFDSKSGKKVYGPKWVSVAFKFPRGTAMIRQAFIGTDGKAVNGLQVIDGKTYYFQNNYPTTSQKVTLDGVDYYFDKDGVGTRLSNPTYKNQYYTEDGKWYYAGSDGKALTGSQTIDGVSVYFNKDGSQVKGDFENQNPYTGHYYDPDTGAMWKNRFVEYEGKWYYLDEDGETVRGAQLYNNQTLFFDTYGRQIKGELTYQPTWTKASNGNYFYRADNNFAYYYYDKDTGARAQSQYVLIDNHWYYFDENGRRVSGAKTIDNQDVYFDERTNIQVKGDFVTLDGKKYYYDDNSGARVKNETRRINGKTYQFDANGVATEI